MPNVTPMRLCATSVMLPRWTLDETFDRLKEAGYQGIELRVRPAPADPGETPSFWGRHLSDVGPANVLNRVADIRNASARTGLRVVALSPRVDLADASGTDLLFRAAVAIDPASPPMVRMDPPRYNREAPYGPQFSAVRRMFASAITRARPYGVKILYEIHTGTQAMSATRAATLLEGLDPAGIGAIYDIPNMTRVGLEDPRQGMDALGPYLAHCHIGGSRPVLKPGAAGHRDEWTWEFCSLQQGVADIPAILGDFRHVGYGGWLSLEDFSPGDDLAKIRDQAAWLSALLAPA